MGAAIFQVLALSVVSQIATFATPFHLPLVVDEAIGRADRSRLTVLALGFGALAVLHAALEALRNWVLRPLGPMMSFQVVGNFVGTCCGCRCRSSKSGMWGTSRCASCRTT